MANTFEQMCSDIRNDMRADGLYDMADGSVYWDIAEAMLFDPEFKRLAQQRFPLIKDDQVLRERVADCIAFQFRLNTGMCLHCSTCQYTLYTVKQQVGDSNGYCSSY